jgi:hypothetical protein
MTETIKFPHNIQHGILPMNTLKETKNFVVVTNTTTTTTTVAVT